MRGAEPKNLRCICGRSFWTLSGSPNLLAHPSVGAIVSAKGCTPAQALFKIAQMTGVTPISGTTNETHMGHAVATEKLDFSDVQTSVEEVLEIIRA